MKTVIERLSHTAGNYKYHVVFAPKYRRTEKNKEYIKDQLKQDQLAEQLIMDLNDPFTGK